MKASVLDLRYRMRAVLDALERRESVTLLHRGKVKGTILPAGRPTAKRMEDHPFFGINRDAEEPVPERMARMRKARYRDL